MKRQTYAEKLRDPRWQKKRLEVMHRDGFACQSCNATDKPLAVHHRYYISRRAPWEYPGFCLRTLCEDCHSDEHFENRDESGEVTFEEWETEMDWLTLGGSAPNTVGEAWYVMATISEGRNAAKDTRRFWRGIEAAIEKISEEESK